MAAFCLQNAMEIQAPNRVNECIMAQVTYARVKQKIGKWDCHVTLEERF